MLSDLRSRVFGEEFDSLTLREALRDLERPRDKVTSLLRRGDIIRVKQGIYVFGKSFARRPYSREVLANMIYGPSCVSLDSALSYYGLIPERVEAVTSVTCGRGRRFFTPLGLFTYKRIPMRAYAAGYDQVKIDEARSCLMAGPEKALADKIYDDRGLSIRNQHEMKIYLSEDLRIDLDRVAAMDPALFVEFGERYRSRKIRLLSQLIRRLQKTL